ncbi:hypothetical protein NECID01_0932 [Nematocida sp. AWRm77]|nr:hypothetical protein NECID01_0932 [Nematocida sp. AWRm77]
MRQYRKNYPDKRINIIINNYEPGAEHSEDIAKILAQRRTGTYTFLLVGGALSLTGYDPSISSVEMHPVLGTPESMLFPPEYFKKPKGPFDKYDPDDDELPPPGAPYDPSNPWG